MNMRIQYKSKIDKANVFVTDRDVFHVQFLHLTLFSVEQLLRLVKFLHRFVISCVINLSAII